MAQIIIIQNPECFHVGDILKFVLKYSTKNNYITLSDMSIKDLIPYLCVSDMYVGNDSFGSHITSQSGKKSIIMLLDSPKAYTDYSDSYYRVVPDGYDLEKITHGTNVNPNLISVKKVIKTIYRFKN